ncbi:MAG: diacylglycerol/lipid kinase family protein [Halanaerobiales bacterium]
MQPIMAIVNPVSHHGKTAKVWPEYERYFRKHGIELEKRFTSYPGHAIELTRSVLAQGYHQIMAVGGDGTINEVANGLYRDNKLINEDSRLIVFSQGTGCDYIRTLGIDNHVESIVEIIKRNQVKYLDLGKVSYLNHDGIEEERFFVNLADTGIGAAVAKLVNESSKVLGGFLTYLLGVLRTLISYKNKKIRVIIDQEEKYFQYLNSVIIANGKYFGGGIKIAPEADPESDTFNIVLLKNFNKLQIIINLVRAYEGTHLKHRLVDSLTGKKIELQIEGNDISELELDGESVGTLPASFEILEKKLPLLV